MVTHRASSKRRLALISSFLALFVLILNATTYTLYRRAETHLEAELGERLRVIAVNLAHAVEMAGPDSLSRHAPPAEVVTLLYLAQGESGLSNVVLLTTDGTTIVDLAGLTEPGETNPFVALDAAAVTMATSGLAATTGLYKSGEVFMKSAYAPVVADTGVVGVLGVEAGADFFSELRALSRMILLISLASGAVVVILGGIFYRQSRSLDRAQEAVLRQENLATMGHMVANIAHEVRNPLSIIGTAADRLRRKYGEGEEAIDYIREEVEQLGDVLTGYLDFAQAQRAPHRAVSIRRVIERCILAATNAAENAGVTVAPPGPGPDLMVLGDEKRLRQAVLNVMINAVQASPAGAAVAVSLDEANGRARIRVRDRGDGIKAAEIANVTRPFYTTKASGSGLGLHVVSTVVEEHGGAFDIRSSHGDGTTVELSFPLAPERS